jgi:hypothetical protein
VVEFDDEVTIEDDAFNVVRLGGSGGPVAVSVATSLVNGRTVATLNFSGTRVAFGSLVDGNYQLTIDGSKIKNQSGLALDGDLNGTAGGNSLFGDQPSDKFFRLYGDIDGSRSVNLADFAAFRSAFGSQAGQSAYRHAFDFDDGGAINLTDFAAFRTRFGSSI